MKNLPLKIDLHVHTYYSVDATTTLKEVVDYSKKRGLDGIAVTDHDTLKGALKLAEKSEIVVISGVEISTLQGHVLALNVTKLVPSRLTLSETVRKIHDAGGIAVAAHPATIFKVGMTERAAANSNFDAVEVINSIAFPFFLSTNLSRKLAERLKLPKTAGSDAHHAAEIGMAYTIIDADSDADEIVEAIKRGATIPFGKAIPWTKRIERVTFSLKRRG